MVSDTDYKRSEVGIIPNDWNVVSFEDVCEIVNGQVDPTIEPYCDMPHIGNANIDKFSGKLLSYKSAKEEQQISGKYLFNDSHILYGKINPHFAKVAFPKFTGICSADIYPIKPLNDLSSSYLKYLLLDNRFISYTTSVSGRTGIPKVNRKDLVLYKFALPPVLEQKKIASIITSIDNTISISEAIIEQTEKVKKGLMQQLLTKGIGHTKFKETEIGEIPEEWKIKSLSLMIEEGDIISHLDGNHGSYYPKADEFVEEGVPYLSANCIKNGRIDWQKAKYLTHKRTSKFKKGLAKNNDVLFAHNATVGPVAILETNLDVVVLSTTLTYYRCNPDKLLNKYLGYYMQSSMFINQYTRVMKQSTRSQIPITIQRVFHHVIPPLEEQKKVAEIISTLAQKVEIEQQKLSQLQTLKKGLMQVLLTGKVRVKVDEQEAVNT